MGIEVVDRPQWVDPGPTASAIGALFFREGWFVGHSHVNHTRDYLGV